MRAEDIYNLIRSEIHYGIRDNLTKEEMDPELEEDTDYVLKNYRVNNPHQTLDLKYGACYDQALLVAYLTDDEYSFIYMETPDGYSHTFTVIKDQNTWYRIETAWEEYRGVYSYKTKEEAYMTFLSKFDVTYLSIDNHVEDFFDKKNIPVREFLERMTEGKVLIDSED